MSVVSVSREVAVPVAAGVESLTRDDLRRVPRWLRAFQHVRKDHRFFELMEDTLPVGYEYRYFAVKDNSGTIIAIQPYFLLDQDMLAGIETGRSFVARVRKVFPRFLVARTLMVGCVAGEGHIDSKDNSLAVASVLSASIVRHARVHRAGLIVLKEFPSHYRPTLDCFLGAGFTRIPSMPMTGLPIAYPDFESYMDRVLSANTRRNLRKAFKAATKVAPVEMQAVTDVTPYIREIYPLYLQVYERSKFHFEKLTPEFFCQLARKIPDKTRFFIWRQNDVIVAFALCMTHGDTLWAEYLGLDYSVALELHLYNIVMRDVISWAMAEGYANFKSSGLNYEPKLHMRHRLQPLDLYVRHTSSIINPILRRILPYLEPTHANKILAKFPNYADLYS